MHGTIPRVTTFAIFVLVKQQRSECSDVGSKMEIKRQLLYVRWRRQAILGEEVSSGAIGRRKKKVIERKERFEISLLFLSFEGLEYQLYNFRSELD